MADMSDIALGVSTSILGAALGPVFQTLFTRDGESRSVRVGGDNHGPIDQSVHHEKVYVSLPPAPIAARRAASAPRRIRRDSDDSAVVGSIIVGVIIATVLYLRYQSEIIGTLVVVGAFCMSFLLSALGWARWRKVQFSRRLAVQGLVLMLCSAATYVDLAFLHAPPMYHGRSKFSSIVSSARTMGFGGLVGKYGLDALIFVAYQLMGLVLVLLALAAVLVWSAKLLALTNAALSTKVHSRWQRIAASNYNLAVLVWGVPIFALLSLLFTSGFVYSVIPKGSQIHPPATRSVTPSGASHPPTIPAGQPRPAASTTPRAR